jgi:hypothetical protein
MANSNTKVFGRRSFRMAALQVKLMLGMSGILTQSTRQSDGNRSVPGKKAGFR